jgi:hypothetical protein
VQLSLPSFILSFTVPGKVVPLKMNPAMENSSSTNHHPATQERKQSPPAFLDLADSVSCSLLRSPRQDIHDVYAKAARLGSNMPDLTAVSVRYFVPEILHK